MLYESPHIRIDAEFGTATLWLGFGGEPANALDLAGLREIDAAFRFVEANPAVRILIVRSAHSGGFCTGIRPAALATLPHPTDRAAFAWYAQQVADRLARLQAVTIAFIEGPCLGAGLELALACDYRLCVAGPRTTLGFPDGTLCCGGSVRLRNRMGRAAEEFVASRALVSGREARDLKLVDAAFCERRLRIELRTFLDQIELRPVKPERPLESAGLAAERRAFAAASAPPIQHSGQRRTINPLPRFPGAVGVLGDDASAARLAADASLQGSHVLVGGDLSLVLSGIHARLSRGFITPLEAENAQRRVRPIDSREGFRSAGLVLAAAGGSTARSTASLLPRTIVGLVHQDHNPVQEWLPHGRLKQPRVVGVRFRPAELIHLTPISSCDADAPLTLASWLRVLGRNPVILPPGETANSSVDANSRAQNDCGYLLAQLG